MDHPSDSLPALALRTSPESDALGILGQLLDSLPIGFYITDCSNEFRIVYANRAWERVTGAERPLVGRPLGEIVTTAEQSGLLEINREVRGSGRPRHLKGFELGRPGRAGDALRPGPGRWDWEIYPLSDAAGQVTHVLSVVFKLGAPSIKRPMSEGRRREANRRREEAGGVLRIFGMSPDTSKPEREVSDLTQRERRVADLVAAGLTNVAVAQRLGVSPSTVSSHVAHILAKFEFRSRAQIAAWAVEQRLRRPTTGD